MTPFHHFQDTLKIAESAETLEWEVIGNDLWLRPEQDDVEVVWCYLGQGKLKERLIKPSRQKAVYKKIGKALAAKRFWRYWPLGVTDGDLFLRRDFGLIRLPDKSLLARFNFGGVFKNADEVLGCGPRRFKGIVKDLERQDDFQQALAWLLGYEDGWSNFYFERGSRSQLDALLKSFWALFRPPDNQFEQWVFFSLLQKDGTVMWHWPHAGFARAENSQAVTRRLFELMHESIVLKQLPLRHYTLTGEPEYEHPLQVVAPLPSNHDRMEALLIWRKFLSAKVPPEEIGALLPQF